MKKILKFRTIIILLLVFTISFNMISTKEEKSVQAVAVLDDALFWTLGLLVLSTGVVAINSEQIIDMGTMVHDKLSLNEEEYLKAVKKTSEDLSEQDLYFNQGLIKVTDKLKEVVNEVASTLTIEDKEVTRSETVKGDVIGLHMPFVYYHSGSPQYTEYYHSGVSITIPYNCESVTLRYGSDKNASLSRRIEVTEKSYGNSYKIIFGRYTYDTQWFGIEGHMEQMGDINYNYYTYIEDIKFNMYGESENTGVVSKDIIHTIPYSDAKIKEGYNPTYTDENLKADTYIPIPQAVPTDTAIATDIPLTWDKAIDAGLITDIPKERVGDYTDGLTGEVTGTLENGLDISFPNIFEMLKDLLIYLFKPTLALEDLFPFPNDTGFADLVSLYDFSSIWNITPKPIEFKTEINKQGVNYNDENIISRLWNIEFKPFEVPFIKNNLDTIRNVFSYSLLLSVIYAIVHHLLPKREMD